MRFSAETIQTLNDFQAYVQQRLAAHFSDQHTHQSLDEIPELSHPALRHHRLSPQESVLLLCALAPHLMPGFYDELILEFLPGGGEFAAFGGVKGSNTRYMLPTGDTALFLLAGTEAGRRPDYYRLLGNTHWLQREHILWLESVKEGEPRMSGRLILSADFLDLFIEGSLSQPAFGPDFPARLLSTRQSWDELVLPEATREHLQDLHTWLRYNDEVLADARLGRRIKPGYRALFYGPSGGGKTFVATLLGQQFQKEVYRIDLSQVVSKYIGETEKNLEKVFQRAGNRDWILFFDEADALFGKRSSVQNAHDKYANQEVSYLLQRVEDFPGMVILASNFKSNIDAAFLRRFNSIIEFPMPGPAERLRLWELALPAGIPLDADVNLKQLADRYELTGSAINSVMHYAALQRLRLQQEGITAGLLIQGIQREVRKEDKLTR